MDREEGGVMIMGRTEIDTRSPFKSVKEAVMLFGERVLVGEIYANKLKEVLPFLFLYIHVYIIVISHVTISQLTKRVCYNSFN